jgi:GT2 family glycosyltransferase
MTEQTNSPNPIPSTSTPAPKRIGIITVLYNSSKVLPDFFASIAAQTYRNLTVYCVDNASKDDSASQCRAQGNPYFVIESPENVGIAAGNNLGIRAALEDGCEYILLLNNDVTFNAELIELLLDGLDQHQCDMTTPLIYYFDKPDVIWAAGGYFQPLIAYRSTHHAEGIKDDHGRNPKQVSYCPTCCVLVRREIFETVGLMDERFFVYYDDSDFMLRAWKAGRSLYLLPQAHLWHKVGSVAAPQSIFTLRYATRGHAIYIAKHLPRPLASFWSIVHQAIYLGRWLLGRTSREVAFARIQAWRQGIALARTRQPV